MTTDTQPLIPKWFKPTCIVALLWNLMGLAAFGMFMALTSSKESMDAAKMTEQQQALIASTPAWVNVAFAIAVIFGVAGCVALLMRRKFSVVLLVLSMLGVFAQCTWIFLLSDASKIMGVGLSPLTIIVSIALTGFSLFSVKKSWLS